MFLIRKYLVDRKRGRTTSASTKLPVKHLWLELTAIVGKLTTMWQTLPLRNFLWSHPYSVKQWEKFGFPIMYWNDQSQTQTQTKITRLKPQALTWSDWHKLSLNYCSLHYGSFSAHTVSLRLAKRGSNVQNTINLVQIWLQYLHSWQRGTNCVWGHKWKAKKKARQIYWYH